MAFDLEKFAMGVSKSRTTILAVIVSILVVSFGVGYVYQQKTDKETEATALLDEAWQKIAYVISLGAQQPNHTYADTEKQLYTEGLTTLDILVNEYASTIAGARAAIAMNMVMANTNLYSLSTDQALITNFSTEGYLDSVKKQHVKFWSSALYVIEGIKAEQIGNAALAIENLQTALKKDKGNYLQDYILMSIARNYEAIQNHTEAIHYYTKLVNEVPHSSWLSYAMGRIYILNNANNEEEPTE